MAWLLVMGLAAAGLAITSARPAQLPTQHVQKTSCHGKCLTPITLAPSHMAGIYKSSRQSALSSALRISLMLNVRGCRAGTNFGSLITALYGLGLFLGTIYSVPPLHLKRFAHELGLIIHALLLPLSKPRQVIGRHLVLLG